MIAVSDILACPTGLNNGGGDEYHLAVSGPWYYTGHSFYAIVCNYIKSLVIKLRQEEKKTVFN